ncbi:MAG: amino acid adenylation domain-containing protein [Halopseudomonas aestusnigri]
MKLLDRFAANIEEYCYTDLSKAFLHHAEDQYGRSFLVTKRFDVGLSPEAQGFDTGRYDLVVAANVLHATPNMRTTLRNAQALLKGNGLLVLNELSSHSLYAHVTFGLLDGWWLYEDAGLRLPGSPGLYPATWKRLLRGEGFDEVWLPSPQAQDFGQQIILAQSDGIVRQAARQTAKQVTKQHSEHTRAQHISKSVTNTAKTPEQAAKLTQTPEQTPTNRREELGDHVWNTLKRVVAGALDIPLARIEADRSFSEYGVDSIVAVKLVNEINEALGLLLQTTVLFDYNTLDVLTRHIEENHIADVRDSKVTPQCKAPIVVEGDGEIYTRALIKGPGQIDDLALFQDREICLEPHQVRVRVRAASLNFSDLLCVKGLYPNMPPYPFTPGAEAAGNVVSVGSAVTKVVVGDEVVCMAQGCHAALVTCAEEHVQPKPKELNFEEASALPTVALTMLDAFDKADMEPGESVLIQTATGGTGLIAVQLAQHLGAEIYATAGSQEKLEYLKNLGIKNVINYLEMDFETEIKRLTRGRGVDVVINTLSGDAMQKGLNCLAPGGRYVEIAMAALKSARAVDLSVLNSNQSFFSVDLTRLISERPKKIKAYREKLADLITQGVLRPTLSKIFPFSQLKDAYRHLENRENIGKVVLSMTALEESSFQPSMPELTQGTIGVDRRDDAIAIIGMAGRFARSENVEAFWEHLASGTNLVDEVSRWDLGPATEDGCRHGSFLDRIDCFDPLFFRMSGLEATYMDPQQRLFLEEAWHALEDAGYAGDAVRGSSCGVYVGCAAGDYHYLFNETPPPQAFWGNSGSVIPARIAYHLDLQGPAVAVDTACSSSLVAMHTACQGLRLGETDMAIAGGVFLQSTPGFYASANPAGMLSSTGRCHTFDKKADGFVPGEGVGAVILKRLSDALADGDNIQGVIRGSGLNQDGHSNGITAPSALSQERLQRQVYDRFSINPESLQMVEAHGTGTKLGDPIEVRALTNAFRHYTDSQEYCALGSVKTNIGHLAAAAGIAGLLKILLSMRHNQIPPSLNFTESNPSIQLTGSPFKVNTVLKPWAGNNKRAAISSFGFSGTNAHMVIEEAPEQNMKPSPVRTDHLVVLSARTSSQLRVVVENLVARCDTNVDLGNMAFTLLMGRDHRTHRLACVVTSIEGLERKLSRWLAGEEVADLWTGEIDEGGIREQGALLTQGERDIAVRNNAGVAALYVQGYRLDYGKLFGKGFRRVSLPLYPFAKERHWVEQEARHKSLEQTHSDTTLAPTLARHTAALVGAETPAVTRENTVSFVRKLVAETLRISYEDIRASEPLESYGIDSILVVQLTDSLRSRFSSVSSTLLFEVQSIDGLVDVLMTTEADALVREIGGERVSPSVSASTSAPIKVPDQVSAQSAATTDIAVIGMAGRYPEAPDLDVFWENLKNGRDCITEVPGERWDWRDYHDPVKGKPGKSYTNRGGFISDIDRFDPRFFRIPPADAQFIDPQERLFLEIAWRAIEDAGHTPESLSGEGRTGVFVGAMNSLYLPQASHWSIPNRVSYVFNFTGPSLAVDTACSSSLTAIHLAMEGLRSGTCETAIVGGVNLIVHPLHINNLASVGMLSKNGHCSAFGDGADGFVDAEGVGALVLKPLAQAITDGDSIHGVFKGSMINAGGKTSGFTVPNPVAQGSLIAKAFAAANVDPVNVSYIEAHGTGTELGDPIELSGLAKAFGDVEGSCAVGSVKSNIGHPESAAGIAGVTKVLLQMRHGELVPSLNAEALNPKLDLDKMPFSIQRELAPWPKRENKPRTAGVSSFGAGGANAHLVIEEYLNLEVTPIPTQGNDVVIILSAMNTDRLRATANQLSSYLSINPDLNLLDVAWTLQVGRRAMPERLAFRATSIADVQGRLAEIATLGSAAGVLRGTVSKDMLEKNASPEHGLGDWVQGAQADWRTLYNGVPPRRVSLPGYPFFGERYWAPEDIRYGGLMARTSKSDLLYALPIWKNVPAGTSSGELMKRQVFWLGTRPKGVEGELLETLETDLGLACCDVYKQLFLRLKTLMKAKSAAPVLIQIAIPSNFPLFAGVSGMLRSAGLEQRNLQGQVIAFESDEAATVVNAHLLENAKHPLATEVRYRSGNRQIKMLNETILPAAPVPWKDGGVYLLTGGAGGLGLVFSKDIAAQTEGATIVLVGRSSLDQAQISDLKEIEALGAKVVYAQLDVTKQGDVETLIQKLVKEHGKLTGVLHTAGILKDSYAVNKEPGDFDAVLAPKIQGTVNLDLATRGLDLDMFVLFSSGAGLFGNAGQTDYATANAFLDTFASERDGRVVSINWPLWNAGGMSIDEASQQKLLSATGMIPLSMADGIEALYRVLASGMSQMMVVGGNLAELRTSLIGSFNGEVSVEIKPEKITTDIHKAVLETIASLLQVGPEEIDPAETLMDYGVDSIVFTRLSNELNQAYDLDLWPSDFLEYDSVDLIAAHLANGKSNKSTAEVLGSEQNESSRWPLSIGQQGLWLLQQAEPDSSVYNIPYSFMAEEGFNSVAFRSACIALWNSTPILRTVFGSEDGVPFQSINESGELPFFQEDVSSLKQNEVLLRVQKAAKTPFDMAGPLMRVHLFKNNSARSVVLLCIHHTIVDGVSVLVLLKQLKDTYEIIFKGGQPSIPQPAGTYSDFVAWEKEMLAGDKGVTHLSYWRGALAGELPVINLPFDHPQPDLPTKGRQALHVDLLSQLAGQVGLVARSLKVSPAVLFLTVFKILLAKLSGQQDIVVGMTTMGRRQKLFESVIGYFVNVIALRVAVEPDRKFRDLVNDLRAVMLRGQDHDVYPFPALVRDLKVKRDESHTPIFQVGYGYMVKPEESESLVWESVESVRQEGDMDLGLEIVEHNGNFSLHMSYNADMLETMTAERMLIQYMRLLSVALNDLDKTVADLSLMDRAEFQALMDVGNIGPLKEKDAELVTIAFAAQVQRTPDAPALFSAEDISRNLTYKELDLQSDKLAIRLNAEGVKCGDRVGLFLNRSFNMVVGLLGVLKAGAVYVPLDTDHPETRIRFILSECDMRAILVEDATSTDMPTGIDSILVNLDQKSKKLKKRKGQGPVIKPSHTAYIIYTSGSTGKPKGVCVSHGALADHCRTIADYYALTSDDRVLQFAGTSVDTSIEQILPGLLNGAALILRGNRLWTVQEFDRMIAATGITVADLPPTYLREILMAWKLADFNLHKKLRLMIIGGEAVTPETIRLYQASPLAQTRLVNAYGPTETTITCLTCDLSKEGWAPTDTVNVPIGRPLPNTKAYVLDNHGQPVSEGVAGELFVGGIRVAEGYLNRDDLTATRFVPDPFNERGRLYSTGDMVRVIPGRRGLIEFIGRTDDQIKVRGFRVELGEVEAALSALPGVVLSTVIALDNPDGDYDLVGFVVRAKGSRELSEILDELRMGLPTHMVPRRLFELDVLPLNAGGKVNRSALSLLVHESELSIEVKAVTDDPDIVERLASIWCEVLSVSSVTADDDFFELGGHSILAVRLMSRIQVEFGRELPLASLLSCSAFKDQVVLLSIRSGAPPSLLVDLQAGEDGEIPLFLIHAVGGGVMVYNTLVANLNPTLPVFGLQSPGLCGAEQPSRLEDLAALHVAALRAHQPQGPYRLSGWSFGGVLAYEVAQQLTAAGEVVASLDLIDSYTPAAVQVLEKKLNEAWSIDVETARVLAFATDILCGNSEVLVELERMAGKEPAKIMFAKLCSTLAEEYAHLAELFEVFKSHLVAMNTYVPKTYRGGAVTLISADHAFGKGLDSVIDHGWNSVVPIDQLTQLAVLTANHYNILDEPNVRELAIILNDDLGREKSTIDFKGSDKLCDDVNSNDNAMKTIV